MTSRWRTEPLFRVADVIFGYPFDSDRFNSVRLGSPVIRIRDLKAPNGCLHTTEQGFPETVRVKAGDLLVGMDAEFRPYRWSGASALLNQRVCKVVPRTGDALDREFLRAAIAAPLRAIESAKSGTTVTHLNKADLERVYISWAPAAERRLIAHTLGALDDKIELNRNMKRSLEAMAWALFKSWFVDFEPVRAKAEGRDPGLPSKIGNLFPETFEDSEFGEVPAGWEVRSLDSIATFLNGLALQGHPPSDGPSLPVIKIAQLRKDSVEGADRCSTDIPPDQIVNVGDVLFSWSGSLECVLWAGGLGALNQHLFKVTSGQFPRWFYYLWIHEHLENFRHIAAGKATTMGHIQRYHLSEAKVIVPELQVLNMADKVIGPAIKQVIQRTVESRAIAALRDTLLPKLMTGEVRVPVSKNSAGPES